jgi:hypothetical protein
MILADTSVWIFHFRYGLPHFSQILQNSQVATHPIVLGELATGFLHKKSVLSVHAHHFGDFFTLTVFGGLDLRFKLLGKLGVFKRGICIATARFHVGAKGFVE